MFETTNQIIIPLGGNSDQTSRWVVISLGWFWGKRKSAQPWQFGVQAMAMYPWYSTSNFRRNQNLQHSTTSLFQDMPQIVGKTTGVSHFPFFGLFLWGKPMVGVLNPEKFSAPSGHQTQAVHHRLHMLVQQAEEGVTCRQGDTFRVNESGRVYFYSTVIIAWPHSKWLIWYQSLFMNVHEIRDFLVQYGAISKHTSINIHQSHQNHEMNGKWCMAR